MRTSFLWFVAAFLLSCLATTRAAGTPIVIVRTDTGYIVATNGVRKGGERVCKLQYHNNEVTLHAAKLAKSTAPDGTLLFDMNQVMWKVYADNPEYVKRWSLPDALDKAIAAKAYELREVPEFQFRLVNVAIGNLTPISLGVRPEIVVVQMNNPLGWIWVTDEPFHKEFELKVGEALVWAISPEPIRKRGSTTLAGVIKLLNEAIPLGEEADFGPPYLIGRLDNKGFRFITSDEGICTLEHRAPIVEEDPRLLRKRKPRLKQP